MGKLNRPSDANSRPGRCSILAIVILLPLAIAFANHAIAQDARTAESPKRTIIPSATERRIALVIGNAAYRNYSPLQNPVNDARAISKALTQAGFKVTLRENASRIDMIRAVRSFGDSLAKDGVALFYFAGHGVQVSERNYLIPVDADIQREDEVQHFSLDAATVLEKMDRTQGRINLLILDACRNNPFGRTTRGFASGLAQMEAPYGTLIAYATGPGRLALDGDGPHGIYTQHLLKHIHTPDLAVEIMFKRVREGVTRETKNAQVPWESSSLRGDFYFAPKKPTGSSSATAAAKSPDDQSRFELAFWESIRSSTAKSDYEAYLQQYPQGRFAPLARARIAAVKGDRVAGVSPSQSSAPAPSGQPSSPAAASSAAKGQDKVAVAKPGAAAPQASVLAAAKEALLPKVGDRWTYRHVDGFKSTSAGTLTYHVKKISDAGIFEALQTSIKEGQISQILIEPEARIFYRQNLFNGEWPPDFAPYLQAFHDLREGAALPSPEYWASKSGYRFPLNMRVVGKETVAVPGGKFEAIKVIAEGSGWASAAAGSNPPRYPTLLQLRYDIWYAPKAKRFVKFSAQHFYNSMLWSSTTFELVDFSLN
jgi:uncharacterized caspase-like protein